MKYWHFGDIVFSHNSSGDVKRRPLGEQRYTLRKIVETGGQNLKNLLGKFKRDAVFWLFSISDWIVFANTKRSRKEKHIQCRLAWFGLASLWTWKYFVASFVLACSFARKVVPLCLQREVVVSGTLHIYTCYFILSAAHTEVRQLTQHVLRYSHKSGNSLGGKRPLIHCTPTF